MYPRPIQRLIDLLTKLPGIGPRQAARLTFFILNQPGEYTAMLVDTLRGAKADIAFCRECFRSIERAGENDLCLFCNGSKRDRDQVCIVEKEMDIANLERSGAFHGLYHVLGGVVSPLDPESPARIRLKELYKRVKNMIEIGPLEVIIATSQTSDGDSTAMYIERMLDPLKAKNPNISISRLGRGLSVGSEVEYADEVTLANALNHRIKV